MGISDASAPIANRIEAHVEFSFKGESHSLSSSLDLDALLEQHDELPDIHAILAQDNQIDTYSYLYEVMQSEELEFKNAQGSAADFLRDGHFDQTAFTDNWRGRKTLTLLQPIASSTMAINDLEQHPDLKNALIQAYNLGKRSAHN